MPRSTRWKNLPQLNSDFFCSRPGQRVAGHSEAGRRKSSRIPCFTSTCVDRPAGRHHRQGDDHRPRPGADLVQIARHPLGDQDHLGRNGRAVVVGDLTQQGQIEAGEAVHRVGAAPREDRGAGRCIGSSLGSWPGQLQGEVGFDAGADFDRPAREDGPATLGELLLQDVAGGALGGGRVDLAQVGQQQDVLALEDRVPFELGDPVAVGLLVLEEPLAGFEDAAARGNHERRLLGPVFGQRVGGDADTLEGAQGSARSSSISFLVLEWWGRIAWERNGWVMLLVRDHVILTWTRSPATALRLVVRVVDKPGRSELGQGPGAGPCLWGREE